MILNKVACYSMVLCIHRSGISTYSTGLVVTWLLPRETAAVSASSVYTIQPCTMSRLFMQSHIRRMHACLTVTCHLHFGQKERDVLHATALTRWRNGYRIKGQREKLTMDPKKKEKKEEEEEEIAFCFPWTKGENACCFP